MSTDEPLLLQYIRFSRSAGLLIRFSIFLINVLSVCASAVWNVLAVFSGVWFIRSLHGLPTYRVNCGVVIKLKNHLISPWAWPKAGCLSSNVYLKKDLCVSLQNPARVGCRMITDWPAAEPANHMWWHYLEGSVSQTLNTNTEILRWKKYISTFLQQVFRAEMTVLLVGWVLCCQWSSSCHWIFELWD